MNIKIPKVEAIQQEAEAREALALAAVMREKLAYVDVRDFSDIDPTGNNESTGIQLALTQAAASGSHREAFIPPGVFRANVIVPPGVHLRGGGTRISGVVPEVSATRLRPANPALPVLWIKSLEGNSIRDIDLVGDGAGVSVAGLRVANDAGTYPGMGLFCHRVRSNRFAHGFHLRMPNAITFLECSANYNLNGWRGEVLSDTWELINCHGDFNEEAQVRVDLPRSVTIRNGDWGNCSSPILHAEGGGVVVFECANVESVNHTHLFEIVNSNLILRGNRIAAQSGNSAAAIVRQTTANARVTFDNNRFDQFVNHGSFGQMLLWETNDASAPPPTVVGREGVCRLCNADFTATTREWHSHRAGAFAWKQSNQVVTSGSYQLLTWTHESYDHGQNFDPATGLFTAPTAGWYQLEVSVFLNEANSGFTRLKERFNGNDATILANLNNHGTFERLGGTRSRYLTAGQTWGVSLFHNKGSDMTVRGASSDESVISITRLDNRQ